MIRTKSFEVSSSSLNPSFWPLCLSIGSIKSPRPCNSALSTLHDGLSREYSLLEMCVLQRLGHGRFDYSLQQRHLLHESQEWDAFEDDEKCSWPRYGSWIFLRPSNGSPNAKGPIISNVIRLYHLTISVGEPDAAKAYNFSINKSMQPFMSGSWPRSYLSENAWDIVFRNLAWSASSEFKISGCWSGSRTRTLGSWGFL